MIHIRTIEIAEPPVGMLAELRRYAAVPDQSQDAVLMRHLRHALKVVQDTADISLLRETVELQVLGREDNKAIRLYRSLDAVQSVTDPDGNSVPYHVTAGDYVKTDAPARDVVITYTTRPDEAALKSLTSVVLDYAANLYYGASAADFAAILQRI